MNILQDADEVPTTQAVAAATLRLKTHADLKAKWDAIVKSDVAALNAKLQASGVQPVVP